MLVLGMCSLAGAQDPNEVIGEKQEGIEVGAIGNEDQLGGFLGYKMTYTTIGIDVREWKEFTPEGDDTIVASFFVKWNAVPKITMPLSGLIPQFQLPGPESVDIQLNLVARIGYEEEMESTILTIGPELQLLTGDRGSFAIRYEYAFDDSEWSELPSPDVIDKHQTFLVLAFRF
jgi:hypothetical protein